VGREWLVGVNVVLFDGINSDMGASEGGAQSDPPHEHINWKSSVPTVPTVRAFFDFFIPALTHSST
jgi:hypothetical protein